MRSSTSNLSSGPCLCTQSPLTLAAGVRLAVLPLYMKYASLPLIIIPVLKTRIIFLSLQPSTSNLNWSCPGIPISPKSSQSTVVYQVPDLIQVLSYEGRIRGNMETGKI